MTFARRLGFGAVEFYAMASRVIVVALLAMSVVAQPARAGAADLLKPLRTLTYEVAVTIGFVRRTPRSGLSPSGPTTSRRGRGPAPAVPQGPEDATGGNVDSKGSIAVDVLAATDDGGLVIDIAENATARSHGKVRLGITRDGDVRVNPTDTADMSDEELALARWIARGFYGDHPLEVGTTWTVDRSASGLITEEHYRVLGVDAKRVTLDYLAESRRTGAEPFASTQHGSLVYDTAMIVPVRVSYEDTTRRELVGAHDEVHASIVLTLLADSFAKNKR